MTLPEPTSGDSHLVDLQARRAAALAALPRIGTSPIRDAARFRFNLEEIALSLGSQLEERTAARDPKAWQLQDLLDDVMDALDATERVLMPQAKSDEKQAP